MAYTGMKNEDDAWALVKTAIASTAETAIIQIQDILDIGSEGRINIPSTIGLNWRWRMDKNYLTDELANKLKSLSTLYRRNMKE